MYSEDDFRIAKMLSDLMTENNPSRKPTPESQLKSWSNDVRLMRESDKRNVNDIEMVLRWCQAHDFWKTVILSMGKFRLQFDRLKMKMNSNGTKHTNVREKANPIFS